MLKQILTGIVIAILLFIGGVLLGKYYFSSIEIKIVEKKVFETKWKTKIVYRDNKPVFNMENFNILNDCYTSPIEFEEHTKNDYLHVLAYDNCKQAEARYKIGQKGNWTYYIAFATGGFVLATGLYLILR